VIKHLFHHWRSQTLEQRITASQWSWLTLANQHWLTSKHVDDVVTSTSQQMKEHEKVECHFLSFEKFWGFKSSVVKLDFKEKSTITVL